MYIFGRSRRIDIAQGRAAVMNAIEAGARASEIIGLPVWAWSSVLSPESGTVMWSTRVEHLEELIAADDALAASDEFVDWVAESDALYSGPYADVVSEVLHGAPTGGPGAYVQAVRTVCANGSIGEGMAVGIEIAETASRITGHQTMFVAPVAGTFGAVGWITSFADLAAMEADNAALTADDEWLKLVDRAGHAFGPDTSSSILRRLN